MANTTVLSQPQTFEYTSRSDIRRDIHHIVCQLLFQRLAQRQLGYAMARTQLSKTDRCCSLKQSCILEDILYRHDDTMGE